MQGENNWEGNELSTFRMVSTNLLYPLTGPYISCNVSLFKMLHTCAELSLGTMKISRTLCNRDSKLWDNDPRITEEGGWQWPRGTR